MARIIEQVTNLKPIKQSSKDATINVIQLDKDKSLTNSLKSLGIPIDSIINKKDAFHITIGKISNKEQLIVIGSDEIGRAHV